MMEPRLKRIVASFYRTAAGNEPVRTFLDLLSSDDRRIVGRDMAKVEFGWPIGMPLTRPVGSEGLREVRSTIRDGKVEARVIFAIDGAGMILLHGFEKRPSRQAAEIETAETRWRDHKRRKDKGR
jgi:phage-related protein